MATKLLYILATVALAVAQLDTQQIADNKYGGAAPTYNQPQQQQQQPSYDFSGSTGGTSYGSQAQPAQPSYYYSAQPSPAVSYSAPIYNPAPQPTYAAPAQPSVQYVQQPAQSYSAPAPVLYQPVPQQQQQYQPQVGSYSYSQPVYQPMSYQPQPQQSYGQGQSGQAPSYGGTSAVSSDPFSTLAQWIIPVILVVGVIIVLFSIFGGVQNLQQVSSRALSDPYFGLEETADNAYKMFLAAMESEDCRQRVLCEAGLKLKSAGINGPMLTMVGKFAPEFLRKRMLLVSESENTCEQFQCTHPYFNSTTHKKHSRRPFKPSTTNPNAI